MNSEQNKSLVKTKLDVLSIEKLEIDCIIGIHPYERETPQPVFVTVHIGTASDAAQTEDITSVIDYDVLVDDVVTLAQQGQFQLIETLAERIAEIVLLHPLAIEVTVTVQKPQAIKHAAGSAFSISRKRRTHEHCSN